MCLRCIQLLSLMASYVGILGFARYFILISMAISLASWIDSGCDQAVQCCNLQAVLDEASVALHLKHRQHFSNCRQKQVLDRLKIEQKRAESWFVYIHILVLIVTQAPHQTVVKDPSHGARAEETMPF